MRPIHASIITAAGILLLLIMIRSPVEPGARATSLEIVARPEVAAEMEAQRLAAETERARLLAETEVAVQRERTLRLLILAGVVAVGAFVIVIAVSGRRRETYILLPGSAEFDRRLLDEGGYYYEGRPYYEGQPVKYLEGN